MSDTRMLPLAGQSALVTGAGRGIGREISIALARAGADIAATARTAADLESLVSEITQMERRCLAIQCDATDPEQVAHMAAEAISAQGKITILVNNAGAAESHKFVDHPDELWDRMLLVNLTSVYYVTKALAPHMIEQRGGRIINIASVAARVGERYIAAYTAAKHGVLGLTRSLAAELVGYNITVNAICPGYVDTPLTQRSISNITARTGRGRDEARKALENMSPQKRLIQPEEIAAAVLFLALPTSKGINGQAINIDGGSIMS